jgi:putative ABC transport system permease protein
MDMEILEGQNFSNEAGPDQSRAFLVSETLVKQMGWSDSPIGKRIQYLMGPGSVIDGHVIGVVKDVLFSSWRKAQPLVIIPNRNEAIGETHLPVLSIKIRPGDSANAIEFIGKQWRELNPESPFYFSFLTGLIEDQFGKYDNLNRIFIYFSVLSIFISCLGLFGLSSFVAESRTKEIGIRKVVGASTWNILLGLSADFIKLVFISILIAAPIGYYGIAKWQELLPHKAGLDPGALVVASSIALGIALLTVGYHAVKAALTDPVKSLRYE